VELDVDPRALREARADLHRRLAAVGRALVPRVRRRSPDDTGDLDRSYRFEVDEANDRVLVGTELLHGRMIELGTTRMAPRAPMRKALAEERPTIERTFERG
jgi:hypothetical protein